MSLLLFVSAALVAVIAVLVASEDNVSVTKPSAAVFL